MVEVYTLDDLSAEVLISSKIKYIWLFYNTFLYVIQYNFAIDWMPLITWNANFKYYIF